MGVIEWPLRLRCRKNSQEFEAPVIVKDDKAEIDVETFYCVFVENLTFE